MTGRQIPQFGLNSLAFLPSFGEISFLLCDIMEMIFPDSLNWQKVKVVWTDFQIFSYWSLRLALTGFDKKGVFYRYCTWLQLSQIKKKNHRREHQKISGHLVTLTSQKSEKQTRACVTPRIAYEKAKVNYSSFTGYLQSIFVIYFWPLA